MQENRYKITIRMLFKKFNTARDFALILVLILFDVHLLNKSVVSTKKRIVFLNRVKETREKENTRFLKISDWTT